MGKEVTVKEAAALPAVAYDYGKDAGTGFEGMTGADLSVPFIAILHQMSPQVDEGLGKAGQLFNTVTKETWDGEKGLVFMPVYRETHFVEWVPKDQGGGLVGRHEANSDIVKDHTLDDEGRKIFGKIKLENGHELVETHYVYGLILNDAGTEPDGFAVISFSSTKIKQYKDWTTAMFTIKGKPPMYANRARFRTLKQKNEKGTWHIFQIEPLLKNQDGRPSWASSLVDPNSALFQEGRSFREMVVKGIAKAAFETERATGDDPEATAAAGSDKVPF